MERYKAIVTLTFEFASPCLQGEARDFAAEVVSRVLPSEIPHPCENTRFRVDVCSLKKKDILEHLAEFDVDYILNQASVNAPRMNFLVNGVEYMVRMNSDRYLLFQQSRRCIVCGLEGTTIFLDKHPTSPTAHFNLYGIEDGKLVLMTKDHLIPKSKGGSDSLQNYRVCCSPCNNLKGDSDLDYSQVAELRQIQANPKKLPDKVIKELIHRKRAQMLEEKEGDSDVYSSLDGVERINQSKSK